MRSELTAVSGHAALAAESEGDGFPVVCLHAGVCDRRMWRPLAAMLRTSCRVVAYDRRGFGETSAVDEARSHVDDLFAVLDHPAVGSPAILVGCSQGGRIAIDAALQAPERVRGLVLVAPAVSGAPPPGVLSSEIQSLSDAMDEAERAVDLERLNALEAHAWLDGPLAPEGRVGGELRRLFLEMNRIVLGAAPMPSIAPPPPAYERLQELRTPTLVIWGDLDFPHLQARCQHIALRVRYSRARIIEGTAHLPTLEQPERCGALIEEFIEEVTRELSIHACPRCGEVLLEGTLEWQENLDGGAPAQTTEFRCPSCDDRFTRWIIQPLAVVAGRVEPGEARLRWTPAQPPRVGYRQPRVGGT